MPDSVLSILDCLPACTSGSPQSSKRVLLRSLVMAVLSARRLRGVDGYYAARPNRLSMNLVWPTVSFFATRLTRPLRIIWIASMPCRVCQALGKEP
jgi:hypothetical protein